MMNASLRPNPAAPATAIASGGELRHPIANYSSLADALRRAAAHPSGHGLVAIDARDHRRRLSYRELLERSTAIAAAWRRDGVPAGGHVLLSLDDPFAFSLALWACLVGGYVAVPLGMGQRWPSDEAALKAAVASLKALDPVAIATTIDFYPTLADTQARFGLDSLKLYNIDAMLDLPPSAQDWSDRDPEQLAIIFPTSGSTGAPKPVTQTGAALLAMAAGGAQMNDFNATDVFLNWMPMEHVGATVFLSIVPVCVAAEQVHVAHRLVRQDILRWLDLMHDYRASVTWVPNYVFNVIVKTLEKGVARDWDLSFMRFLVNAGESITPLFSRRFLERLEAYGLRSNAVRPAFGMSETCSGISWAAGFDTRRERYVGLGAPIPGAEMRIVDQDGNPAREGEVGRLHVRGASVTRGYYKAERDEKFLDGGWFDTGDSGFIVDGELYLTDRENDEIEIEGRAFHSYELEGLIESLPGVAAAHTAVCGVELDGVMTLAVFYVAESGWPESDQLRTQVAAVARDAVKSAPVLLTELQAHELPKTSIGKIQRKVLRRRLLQSRAAAV